jgi:hypothetical protein
MKTFTIDENRQIICNSVKTRYGFRHDAELHENGRFVMKAKACYYNRTWESFEYESVISDLLRKAKIMTPEETETVMKRFQKGDMAEMNARFGMIAGIAKLGEILCDTPKEQNDWKSKMLNAGLGNLGLIMPEDWNTLSEEDKATRLNSVIEHLQK